ENWYDNILKNLKDEEIEVIKQSDILLWFKDNANRYDNIRILKTKLENAIFNKLTEVFIFSSQKA
ncbi:MAG: ATP-dependent Clp protease ATP-binding subunit, partial [Oscillospiraceae bacterium]